MGNLRYVISNSWQDQNARVIELDRHAQSLDCAHPNWHGGSVKKKNKSEQHLQKWFYSY